MNCIFCKILNKETDGNIIYQDDLVAVVDDVYPKAPVHKLILPFKHIPTLNDIEPDDTHLIGHIVHIATETAKQLEIANDGYRLVWNCNAGAGQTVFHLHLHLLGGRDLNWPPG